MKKRLLVAIATVVFALPASASTVVVLARSEGDNTVRPNGNAGNQFNDTADAVWVQPVREREAPLDPLNARRGMIEFDVFGSFGDPLLEESNNWQPGDTQITRALLQLHVDSAQSTRGIGTYDVYGYRARNLLLAEDSADDPNRVLVGTFTTRMNIDEYVTVEIDAAWVNDIWNQTLNRLRPGFQIRARDDAPNRLAIDAYNYDCGCAVLGDPEAPKLELTFAPVPEPATFGFMGVGLIALTGLARRGRR